MTCKEMLSHKEVDAFIRKYNVVIKGYGNKRLKDEVLLVECRMKERKCVGSNRKGG